MSDILDHKNPKFFYRVRKQTPICGIYMVTSPNGSKYIGQSVNIVWRIYKYSGLNCPQQYKLYNSLKKYGWKNHIFEILIRCDKDELNNLEIRYISEYDTFDTENGMNLKSGGNRPIFSEEIKQKMRDYRKTQIFTEESNIKRRNALIGKSLPEETRLRMKEAQGNRSKEHIENHKKAGRKGENNHMYGKKWTDEQKKAHGDKIRLVNAQKRLKDKELCE